MELGGTPRARPALKFANRTYTSSPQSATKRLGTPQSARKSTRFAESTLSRGTTTGNIFRASSMASASAPASRFELGASTLKKSFITSNLTTPETKRVYRDTVAKFTPRGLAAHSDSKELFEMRIPSPPPELNGEELAKRVPRELERRGAVYADQYLSHIVPKNFDDLQRRQFFCILDLRRLKYAANDVFLSRDWKLNILNFAKEFEKSRSLILLRYGLYEFQNVKPNSDVLRRWKISHGLPVDDEEPTPKAAGSTGSKRKATEDIAPSSKSSSSKRRLFDDEDSSTPKRKNDEDQSRKIVKPASLTPTAAPSATLSLFESIANKSTTTKEDAVAAAPVNPSVLATSTSTSNKPNPFASAPAKGNDSESDSDDEDQPTKAESADERPAEDSTGSSVFRSMTKAYGETTEPTSTNSNSDNADKPRDEPTLKKTWTPDTPIKFAPAAPASSSSLFGSSTPAVAPLSTSLFGAKPATTASTTPTTNLFGAKKHEEEKKTEKNPKEENHKPEDSKDKPASLFSSKLASETSKSLFGSTPSALSASDLFGAKKETTALAATSAATFTTPTISASSLFGAKPAESNTPATAPATDLFGGAATKPSPTYSATTSNLFGAAKTGSPAVPATSTPCLFGTQSTTLTSSVTTPLFSAKPAESSSTSLVGTKKEEPAPNLSLFGSKKEESEVPKSIFGSTPTALSTGSSLFGSTPAAAPASTNLLGSSKPSLAPPPTFDFSAPKPASSEPKPLFGADPIEGSPMKQDSPTKRQLADDSMQQDSSPVSKKLFGAISGSAAPTFSFGASTSAPAASAPVAPTFSFGLQPNNVNTNSQPAVGGSSLFGNAGSSFTFGAGTGGASANSSFNNPFTGNNNSAAAPAASVSSFNFGAGGNTSTPTPPPSFNFGAGGASQDSNAGTSNMFSFNASASNNNTAGTRSSVPPSGRKTLVPKSLRGRSNSPAVSQQNNAALPNPFVNGGTPSFNFGNGTNGDTPAVSNTDKKEDTTSTEKDINKTETPKSIFGSNPTAPTSTSLFGVKSGTDKPAVTSLFGAKPSTPVTSLFGSVKIEAPKTFLFDSTPATASPGTASTSVAAETKTGDAEAPQEQINLTEGGPGEEDEDIIYEVRAKMSQFVKGEGDAKSKWETQGVGPLRLLKHKTKGTVRMLLRREPTGHVAFNRNLLAAGKYESTAKSVKIMTAGPSGLETWLAQVKTADAAAVLAKALEEHKACNKKD